MYDVLAPGYEELYKEEQVEKLRVVARHLKVRKSDVLLDVGCGTGVSTTFFDCFAVGVDSSFGMVKQGGGDRVVGSAEALPFKDASFDVVISVTAIHNFADYKKAFCEMERVLKPGGKIVVTVLKKSGKCGEIEDFLCKRRDFAIFASEKDVVLICPGVVVAGSV